jgi:hypothetical protein
MSAKCAAAFPGSDSANPAHLCTQQEVLMSAMTSPDRFTASMDGALYATFAAKGATFLDADNADASPNDCANFLTESGFLAQEYPTRATAIRVVDGRIFPEHVRCSISTARLLCCQ